MGLACWRETGRCIIALQRAWVTSRQGQGRLELGEEAWFVRWKSEVGQRRGVRGWLLACWGVSGERRSLERGFLVWGLECVIWIG